MTTSTTIQLTSISFGAEIAKLTERFTGREWFFEEIDQWLREKDERFFILTGEPGVGKSAIAARLTQIRDDIAAYHFCRARDVETVRPGRILRSLATQLAEHLPEYGLALANTIKPIHLRIEVNINIESMTGGEVTGVYIENLKESDPEDELDILIRSPLEYLQKLNADHQTTQPKLAIILIDSLDEAVNTTGANLVRLLSQLYQSPSLPSWVRFILTSRPDRRVLREFEPLKPFELLETSDGNLSDITSYIKDRINQKKILEVLSAKPISPEKFIIEILDIPDEKSKGNFLYTKLLLDAVETGQQDLDDLKALPKNIAEIYHDFLRRFSEQDWHKRYQPIFGVLAVAKEPISEHQISNFTKIDFEDVRNSIRVIRQFFDIDINKQNQETYSIFHQSFREYLLAEDKNPDFWCNPLKHHRRITSYYWRFSKDWAKCDHYGMSHLASHLYLGKSPDQLANLINQKWMSERIGREKTGAAGFIADLDLAWQAVLDERKESEKMIVESIRYALIRTSLNSISINYPPSLIARALSEGLWSAERVLSLADLLPGSAAVYLIAAILTTGALNENECSRAEKLALYKAKGIGDCLQRFRTLIKLTGSLNGEGKTQVIQQCLKLAKEMESTYQHVDALVDLIPFLSEEEKRQVLLEALNEIKAMSVREEFFYEFDRTITQLAPFLNENLAMQALDISNKLPIGPARYSAQMSLLPRLPKDKREITVDEIFEDIKCNLVKWQSPQLDKGVSELVEKVPSLSESAMPMESLKLADCNYIIRSLAEFLTPNQKEQFFRDGFAALSNFDSRSRHTWLFELGPMLSAKWALKVIDDLPQIVNKMAGADIFANLALLLPNEEDKQRLLSHCLNFLQTADPIDRLIGLPPWLSQKTASMVKEELLRDILNAAKGVAQDALYDLSKAVTLMSALKLTLPHVTDNLLDSACSIVLAPSLQAFQSELLEMIAPKLSGGLLQRAFDLSVTFDDQESRVKAMSAIATQLTGAVKNEVLRFAFDVAMKIEIPYRRCRALATLAPMMDGKEKELTLLEGLKAAKYSDGFWALALNLLAPQLSGELINRGVEVARQFSGGLPTLEEHRLQGLAIMASKLNGKAKKELIDEVLIALRNNIHLVSKGTILLQLIPSLEGESLNQAWSEARKLDNKQTRAKALIEIARKLDGCDREIALNESEEVARTIERPIDRITILADLAKELTEERKLRATEDAMKVTSEILDKGERAMALSILAHVLDATKRAIILQQAFDLLEQASNGRTENSLMLLIPLVDSDLLDRAVEVAENDADPKRRARMLELVADRLIQDAKNSDLRHELLLRISDWLWSMKGANRSNILSFCATTLFKHKILSQSAISEIAQCIKEITEEWRFNLV